MHDLMGTQCQVTAYLKVWVIQAPLRGNYELMVMAITGVVFWLVLFMIYMNHAYRES